MVVRLLTAILIVSWSVFVDAKYPNSFPYRDLCMGLDVGICTPSSAKGQCAFFTDQYPWCFDSNYASQQPDSKAQVGASTLFFIFNAGVHLSEGTQQKIFYNLTPDECALECLRSANQCPYRVRCLSFDFYPFELVKSAPPWNETPEGGVCVLNNENKDSARLRNSDLGYSDANLYYRSHFTYFPFADAEGYYEVRDPRGGGLQYQLDYGAINEDIPATVNTWGGSRWGIYHLEVPQRTEWVTSCPPISPGSDDSERPLWYGGYTPVDENQKCAGLVTLARAEQLCDQTGGYLCSDDQLTAMIGVKLGCGFDGPVRGYTTLRQYPIWSADDIGQFGPNYLKYPRCCAAYSVLDSCTAYRGDALLHKTPIQEYPTCSRYKTATDCVHFGSGTSKQRQYGMGVFMDDIRANCQRDNTLCKGVIQDWTPRDQCVWCPTTGQMDGGGAGECRVGSSLAICQNSPSLLRTTWVHSVRTSPFCFPLTFTACKLIHAYPDLGLALIDGNISTDSPTTLGATRTPTFNLPKPQCTVPTGSPSTLPPTTTQSPTRPTKSTAPTKSKAPTAAITPEPSITTSEDYPSPTNQPTQPACINLTLTPAACKARADCAWVSNRCTVRG